ncbi:MAG: hypothetical protein JO061_08275 [Acidobacteriaceae bacterium]|nr:hypothetical protein [Acidobacteriaceae bacterium]
MNKTIRVIIFLAILDILSIAPVAAQPINYGFSLDTSGLAATGNSYQFQFVLSGEANNSVTISNLALAGGGSTPAGQPTTFTLTDSPTNFFTAQTWQFTPGASLSFTLSSTDIAPPPGVASDVYLTFLETLSGIALPTNDPFGEDALLRLTLTGGVDKPALFQGSAPPFTTGLVVTSSSTGTTGGTGTTGSTGSGPVPEPANLSLIAIAASFFVMMEGFRRVRRAARV